MSLYPTPIQDFAQVMEADLAANARMANLFELLADLRKQHPTDAQLAAHLVDNAGGDWRKAAELLISMRDAVAIHLRLIVLSVALEGKEREQQPPANPNTSNNKE